MGGTCSGRFDPLRELFKMRRCCACLTVIALAGALPVQAEDTPAKSLAITGVTVIDATGAPARPDMTVVITGDRITAIGKPGEVGVPEGATVVDSKGKYLIPGLWDMHVHTADPSFLPLYLANGVTGVRDMHALDPDAIFGLRKQVQEGKQPGPRVVAAGPLVDGPNPSCPARSSPPTPWKGARPSASSRRWGRTSSRSTPNCLARRTWPSPMRRRSRASPSPVTSPSRSAPPRRLTWARRASSTSPGSS